MAATALIPIADGSEDIETVTMIDILRRANVKTTVASVHDRAEVTAARKTHLVADVLLTDCLDQNYDLIALPGGPGAKHFSDCSALIKRLEKQRDSGAWYAAICAAPGVVLAPHGLLDGLAATAFPSAQDALPDKSRVNERVVVDKNCITSQGPGTAMEFSLTLVEKLCGTAQRDEVASHLILPD